MFKTVEVKHQGDFSSSGQKQEPNTNLDAQSFSCFNLEYTAVSTVCS